MKDLLLAVSSVAAALVIVAAAVFGAADKDTLVPPPESVAEDFARKMASARYELAWKHLSSAARERERVEQLRQRFDPILRPLGAINQVEAGEQARNGETAHAWSRVDAVGGEVQFSLTLSRENGLWVVDAWSVQADSADLTPNARRIASLNCGTSSGFREVMTLPSSTTGLST